MPGDTNENPTGSARDKDKNRARAESRPVAGGKKGATGTQGKAGTKPQGNQARREAQRRGQSSSSTPAPRRSPATLLAWGTVALVVVIVVVLVVVKLTSSSTTPGQPSKFIPASPVVVKEVTNIPPSVYNEVGINSPAAPITPPTVSNGHPALVFSNLPGAFYFGAEFCPYCAAERWAIVAALSRFGKFSSLGDMQSSSTDVYPSTPTFTFVRATYTSPYLALVTREYESNVPAPGGGYTLLQRLNKEETNLVNSYDGPKLFPAETQSGSFPFVDIGNKVFVSGASYPPSVLSGLTREEIASGLSDPKSVPTQAIIAAANYLSAGICSVTSEKPASVCNSPGVKAATNALKL
ncbi:MAG: DUF929 family protein [Acidimicrobiales bacterium]